MRLDFRYTVDDDGNVVLEDVVVILDDKEECYLTPDHKSMRYGKLLVVAPTEQSATAFMVGSALLNDHVKTVMDDLRRGEQPK